MRLCYIIFTFLVYGVDSRDKNYKSEINCLTSKCERNGEVCGIRAEGKGFRIRLFQDECALLNYKCIVQGNIGYIVTNLDICSQALRGKPDYQPTKHNFCPTYNCELPGDQIQVCGLRQEDKGYKIRIFRSKCKLWEHNCRNHVNFTITDFYICNGLELPATTEEIKLTSTDMPYKNNIAADVSKEPEKKNNLAIDEDGPSKIEDTDPKLNETNEGNDIIEDDFYFAPVKDFTSSNNNNDSTTNVNNDSTTNVNHSNANYVDKEKVSENVLADYEGSITTIGQERDITEQMNQDITTTSYAPELSNDKLKNIVVVRGLLRDLNRVNETIESFFSATHVFDMPVKEVPTHYLNETTRRRLINIAGPITVYIPQLVIPKNISSDIDYVPTLRSCFHKCPRKCPPTYAPVCGLPGRIAREPSLMFLNHCFMDVAQCKMFYENKSPTAKSSAYVENSFVFCLGDAMNQMYHFLPLLKTLQHMGRLPKKGRFHYRLSNLKFFNNMMAVKNPNLMG